jgi:pimeloyl-ACP methyl ester carboxylesterase
MPYIGTGRISLFFEEAGSGGMPVLLLHELGGSSESWREVIPLRSLHRRDGMGQAARRWHHRRCI